MRPAYPHPLIARRTWLWRAESGEVIEALGFAGGLAALGASSTSDDAGRNWLARLAANRRAVYFASGTGSQLIAWSFKKT